MARLLNVGIAVFEIGDTDLCNVRIKVSRPVDGTSVTVERLDEHIHTHDTEYSRYKHVVRTRGNCMLVTNIFLSQEIIGKYGKNLASGRKGCGRK